MLPSMEYLPTFGIDLWDECGSNIRTSHLAHLGFSSEIRRSIATEMVAKSQRFSRRISRRQFSSKKDIEVKRDANLIV